MIPRPLRKEIKEAVSRGIEYFKEQDIDWRAGVDKELLDMISATSCVLGQTVGWDGGCDALYDWAESTGQEHTDPTYYGFDCDYDFDISKTTHGELYAFLTEEWLRKF